MSVKAYKISCALLVFLLIWSVWKYWSLQSQIVTAYFISNQARHLRNDIDTANSGAAFSRNAGALSERDQVLADLQWYLDYYDHRTNTLAGSRVLILTSTEREYAVRDAITYLRRGSTNDFGDDPYEWLKHEFVH